MMQPFADRVSESDLGEGLDLQVVNQTQPVTLDLGHGVKVMVGQLAEFHVTDHVQAALLDVVDEVHQLTAVSRVSDHE